MFFLICWLNYFQISVIYVFLFSAIFFILTEIAGDLFPWRLTFLLGGISFAPRRFHARGTRLRGPLALLARRRLGSLNGPSGHLGRWEASLQPFGLSVRGREVSLPPALRAGGRSRAGGSVTSSGGSLAGFLRPRARGLGSRRTLRSSSTLEGFCYTARLRLACGTISRP